MSQSRVRDLVEMVKEAGLEVVQHYAKPGRACVDARAPNGLEKMFAVSIKPSDARGDLNEQSKIRRFARENTPIPPAVELPPPVVTPKENMKKGSEAVAAQELTPREFFKLCEWLKSRNCGSVSGLDVLARAASSDLGLTVSEAIMREAMEATDTKEPDAWHPLPDPHTVLARELEALMKSLGQEPSTTFKRLLATL